MAGFQLSIYGRFWVSTEVREQERDAGTGLIDKGSQAPSNGVRPVEQLTEGELSIPLADRDPTRDAGAGPIEVVGHHFSGCQCHVNDRGFGRIR